MGIPIRPLAILILIVGTLATCSGSKNAAPVASTAANRPPEPVQLPTSSPVPPTTVSTPATTANRITTETPELIDGWTLRYPYPIPASCPVTPLQGPYKWIGFPAFGLVADGIRAGFEDVIYADGTKVMLHLDQRGRATMTGERLNGAAPPLLEIDYLVSSGNVSSISFPEPGCWTLDIEAGTASLKATVYVYPVACRQLSGNGTATATPAEPVSACVPPVGALNSPSHHQNMSAPAVNLLSCNGAAMVAVQARNVRRGIVPPSLAAKTRRMTNPWTFRPPPSAGLRHLPAGERKKIRPSLTWPQTLRHVRTWLTPWIWLHRWWQAWSPAPPPPELQALLDALAQGHPLASYDSS